MRRGFQGKIWVICYVFLWNFLFQTTTYSLEFNNGRIIPSEKINLYSGKSKIGEYRKEAPLPENTLLNCIGDCGIKLKDLSFVALDGSWFDVRTNKTDRVFEISEGAFGFAFSNLSRQIIFSTPNGTMVVKSMKKEALSEPDTLKGYLYVFQDTTELGIFEGGSLKVLALNEEKNIYKNDPLILSQNINVPDKPSEPDQEQDQKAKTKQKEKKQGLLQKIVAALLLFLGGGLVTADESDPPAASLASP